MICRYDPFIGFFRLNGPAPMIFTGAAFLIVGMVVARPYCRFSCPYGVLLKWLSKLSRHHLTISPDICIQCRLCEDSCPFGAIRAPSDLADEEVLLRTKKTRKRAFILLPALVLFSLYVSDSWAVLPGLVFLAGRQLYSHEYVSNPQSRGPGMGMTFLANAVLVVGALAGILLKLV